GFFDHTDPDGDTPWARAEQAGVTGLAGENIARPSAVRRGLRRAGVAGRQAVGGGVAPPLPGVPSSL
ncbi:CAP domain-containing protein, partial [Streptomyces narbonensis]